VTWNSIRPWLATVFRLVIGVLWLWSGIAKMHSPRLFTYTVRAYDTTPEWLSKAFGYGLGTLAICLGVLLIIGTLVRWSALLSALLYAAFAIGLIQASARGLRLSWGAFNDGGLTQGPTHYPLEILAVIVLLLAAVFLVLWPFSRISLDEYLTRHDYVEPPSAKRMRTDQGMRKYRAEVEQKTRQARIRDRYLTVSLAVVVVLIAAIGVGVQSGRAQLSSATGDPGTPNASSKYGVVYGKVAAARVDIYEDFSCVQCQAFYQAVESTLEADVKANKAQVHYYSVAFLDTKATDDWSSRAANAAYCVADDGVDDFVKYHDVLFGKNSAGKAVQPPIGGPAPVAGDLANYGKQIGLSSTQLTTLTTCISSDQHGALVQALTDRVSKQGVNAIPTVKVNGKKLSSLTLAALNSAISGAAVKGPKPSPSPTPKPSPSATSSTSAKPSGSAQTSPTAAGSPAS
jgi:protein-disulfide isomerase